MLTNDQREDRYLAQTGRSDLTPRQRRRADHKANRRSQDAVVRREDAVKARAELREERKARRAGLTPRR